MGDDPVIPVGHDVSGGSSNANNYFINNLGKPGLIIIVVGIGLAIGLAVGALVVSAVYGSANRDAADRAEREARMAEYYINILDRQLVEHGIRKAGDDYQKFKREQPKE